MRRDSFEALDVDDLEFLRASQVPDEESGLRRLPEDEPRGLWSDVAPVGTHREVERLPAPPPLPKKPARPFAAFSDVLADAPASDPDDDGSFLRALPVDMPEPERVDMDELVQTLSERPPAPITAPPAAPALAPVPSIAPLALPSPAALPAAPRRRPGVWIGGAVAVAVLAYLAGVATMSWLDRDPEIEQPVVTASQPVTPVVSPPVVSAPLAVEEPGADMEFGEPVEPVVLAPVVLPAPELAPARPAGRAPRPVRAPESSAVAPVVEAAPVEPTPVRAERSVEGLPATPDRAAIQAAMDGIRADVVGCGDEARGHIARVRFTFSGEGRPLHTSVSGVSGTTASCIARTARTARVAPFAEDRFVVEYPFSL